MLSWFYYSRINLAKDVKLRYSGRKAALRQHFPSINRERVDFAAQNRCFVFAREQKSSQLVCSLLFPLAPLVQSTSCGQWNAVFGFLCWNRFLIDFWVLHWRKGVEAPPEAVVTQRLSYSFKWIAHVPSLTFTADWRYRKARESLLHERRSSSPETLWRNDRSRSGNSKAKLRQGSMTFGQ